MEHRLVKCKEAGRDGAELFCQVVFSDDHDLGVRTWRDRPLQCRKSRQRSRTCRPAGQQLQGLFRLFAIALLVGESVQPQQCDGGHGISRGSGRILKRFAPRAQHSQNLLGTACRSVEKSAGHGVKETLHHLVHDALREVEIAQVRGGLIGIEAGDRGEGIVVQQSRDQTPFGGRIGIGDHVLQALLRLPRFGEHAVQ